MDGQRPVRTWDAHPTWAPNLARSGAGPASVRAAHLERAKRIREAVWKSEGGHAEPGAYFPLILLSDDNVGLVMRAAEDAALRAVGSGTRAVLERRPYVGLSDRMVEAWRAVTSEHMLVLRGEEHTISEIRPVLSAANRRLVAALRPLFRAEMLEAVRDLRAGTVDEAAIGRSVDRRASRRASALRDLEPERAPRRAPPPRRVPLAELTSGAARRLSRARTVVDL